MSAIDEKMSRPIERWKGCDPILMATQSEAALRFAFADMKRDILLLHSEVEQLRSLLSDAATSLNTIANQAGKVEGMADMVDVRSYARSRAICAGYANEIEVGK